MRGPAKEQQINLKFDKPSAYKGLHLFNCLRSRCIWGNFTDSKIKIKAVYREYIYSKGCSILCLQAACCRIQLVEGKWVEILVSSKSTFKLDQFQAE